ncbi:hypothetical protein EOA13_33025 [Mesorhizobium sp. M7A.F.Ca.US.011.01.1.1]|uniref:hypothetical protein n=1 Tax=Mesorhizobium sp. M7A.F.Ca.US.011.01.1.1 TaxID=2496741 RepID=UPI000FCAAB75|nr:hypothetical protein [Mesorhizobium sp. M7A.F.Ca.US.011.01.1.1]RUX23779.1 hypothetical protein EOA13_33025 [Mesorhizobium sp. M7A.F.Ca.US.011.01.1.1]
MLKNIAALAEGEALPAANFSRRLALLGGLLAAALAATPRAHAGVNKGQADPLADAIAEYRAGMADFAAIPSELIDMENEEKFVMATYGPAFERLWSDCPPATSLRGVAEAIRFTIESQSICCSSSENTLQAALAFLEQELGS